MLRICVKSWLLGLCLCLMGINASNADPRVQSVVYEYGEIITVKTRKGVATLLQFDENELIQEGSYIGIGDAQAWKVTPAANHIYLKPAADAPDTNLTIVTKKHTYFFRLESAKKNELPTFAMRVTLPKQENQKVEKAVTKPCSEGQQNKNYFKAGDGAIAPSEAWDDGRFTCFRFPNNTALPEVYQVLADGSEALVNRHIDGDLMIIQDIASVFRLRLGSQVLTIDTPTLIPARYRREDTTRVE